MTAFTIYPAIDLLNGKVVRLKQGKLDAQKIYSDDAVKIAANWINAGAQWLHIVNLDGAFGSNTEANWEAINKVLKAVAERVSVQLGSGIRDLAAIQKTLAAGVTRVILGTAAIEKKEFAKQVLENFGANQIAFSVDAKKGNLMTRGWKTSSGQTTIEFAKELADTGAKILIYTDIDTDGMGIGSDYKTAKLIAQTSGLQVIASGGVASLEDVQKVKAAGLNGIVIGSALYEKQITLQEALAC